MTKRDRIVAADIVAADKAHVWHPYTPMRAWLDEAEPLVIARAEGARLWDADERALLDGNSSWWVAVLGHRHPRLVRALREQSESLCHVALAGIIHEPAALLAKELCAAAPAGLTRVMFSDDGSTAVECALKMAIHHWQLRGEKRARFVALDGAFHGETLGCTAVGGIEVFRRVFAGGLVDCVHAPFPGKEPGTGPANAPQGHGPDDAGYERAFAAIEQIIAADDRSIAAVIVEPLLQGASGMRVYPARYLRSLAEKCRERQVLWIADEVFTGFGRTGSMWACERAGVAPDILCTAKGLTGGMLPMAATLATERVFEPFAEGQTMFPYGHSYCGNPLGAAVAREVLAIYRDEQIVARARPKATRIAEAFARMGNMAGIARGRSIGMVGALDLSPEASYGGTLGWRVYREALARGAYLRPLGDTVYVAPPLNIEDEELDELLHIVEESVKAVLENESNQESGA